MSLELGTSGATWKIAAGRAPGTTGVVGSEWELLVWNQAESLEGS